MVLGITQEIREAQSEDESLSALIDSTHCKDELPPLVCKQFTRYTWVDDMLWYDDCLYVPEDKDI